MRIENETVTAPASILSTVEHTAVFSKFLKLVRLAQLTEVLGGPGPVTVFMPVDSAFQRLSQATADELLTDTERLTRVLTYHMVPGKLPISEIMTLTGAATLSDAKIDIYGCNGVMINDARVIRADIDCTNGMIHAIDTVLFPR